MILTVADYSKDIIELLTRAPEGLAIRKIVRHVYNARNSFFETVDIQDVKAGVSRFLSAQAKLRSPLVVRGEDRGVYKLNASSRQAMQLMLDFNAAEDAKEESAQGNDGAQELSFSFE